MRILSLLVFFGVLALAPAAFADATAGPGQCIEEDNGCGGCGHEVCNPPLPPDLATPVIRDLSPHDQSGPPDACREHIRRKNRANGRGLVLLSGLTSLAILALRRRYRTIKPTPAENVLAASAMRKDS